MPCTPTNMLFRGFLFRGSLRALAMNSVKNHNAEGIATIPKRCRPTNHSASLGLAQWLGGRSKSRGNYRLVTRDFSQAETLRHFTPPYNLSSQSTAFEHPSGILLDSQ